MAAILGTSETVDHPQGTVNSNLLGALNVFEAARKFGVRVTHITVGNYWMNNPYAITKNAAERTAMVFNKNFGSRIAVVRGLNAYGERQKTTPVRKIVPNSPQANYLRALIEHRKKNPAAARDIVLQVLKAAPDHLASLLLAGIVEFELGSHAQAQGHLGQVLASAPGNLHTRKLLIFFS